MELYREKKAGNLMTVNALLELKDLLFEEFKKWDGGPLLPLHHQQL